MKFNILQNRYKLINIKRIINFLFYYHSGNRQIIKIIRYFLFYQLSAQTKFVILLFLYVRHNHRYVYLYILLYKFMYSEILYFLISSISRIYGLVSKSTVRWRLWNRCTRPIGVRAIPLVHLPISALAVSRTAIAIWLPPPLACESIFEGDNMVEYVRVREASRVWKLLVWPCWELYVDSIECRRNSAYARKTKHYERSERERDTVFCSVE